MLPRFVFKLLVFEGLFYMYECETDCKKYEITCLSSENILHDVHRRKLCDGKPDCSNKEDESEQHCGNGCLTTRQYEHRFINCGSKFINIINAWNVLTEYSLNKYKSSGEAINISKMYSHCNSLHQCDIYFTEGPYRFAVLKFQCEEFLFTSPPTFYPSLKNLLENSTNQNKPFSQKKKTETSIVKDNKLPVLSSFSPSTIHPSLKIILSNFTKQKKSFPQTTTTNLSSVKEDELPLTYIIIGVLGGVILCVLIPFLLYRLRRQIVDVKQKTARSIPKINTMENVTYAEGHIPHTKVHSNDQIENVNENEHEGIEYATPNKIKNVQTKSYLEADYICNSSDTYDHLRVVYKKSQNKNCENIYDHSTTYGPRNEDEYDSIQR